MTLLSGSTKRTSTESNKSYPLQKLMLQHLKEMKTPIQLKLTILNYSGQARFSTLFNFSMLKLVMKHLLKPKHFQQKFCEAFHSQRNDPWLFWKRWKVQMLLVTDLAVQDFLLVQCTRQFSSRVSSRMGVGTCGRWNWLRSTHRVPCTIPETLAESKYQTFKYHHCLSMFYLQHHISH